MADFNIQMKKKQGSNSDSLYPITKDSNIKSSSSNANLPSGTQTAKDVFDSLGKMAFDNGEKLIYLDDQVQTDANDLLGTTEINDDDVSTTTTWSSSKLKALFEQLGIDFSAENTTVSSYKLPNQIS